MENKVLHDLPPDAAEETAAELEAEETDVSVTDPGKEYGLLVPGGPILEAVKMGFVYAGVCNSTEEPGITAALVLVG